MNNIKKVADVIENKSELPSVSDYETLKTAISKYGIVNQIDMAIEEMSELTKALLKHKRYARLTEHEGANEQEAAKIYADVCEEMADVIIMLNQLQMIYDNKKEVSFCINSKVERLKARMEGGKANEQHNA